MNLFTHFTIHKNWRSIDFEKGGVDLPKKTLHANTSPMMQSSSKITHYKPFFLPHFTIHENWPSRNYKTPHSRYTRCITRTHHIRCVVVLFLCPSVGERRAPMGARYFFSPESAAVMVLMVADFPAPTVPTNKMFSVWLTRSYRWNIFLAEGR